ncbi:MAG: hypothetical protein E7Z94_04505 [Actinomyces ruminicola]|nr:hypothetical protein [Actinomyces ruminicola]
MTTHVSRTAPRTILSSPINPAASTALPTVVSRGSHDAAPPPDAVIIKRSQYLLPTAPPPIWRQQQEVNLARLLAVQRTNQGGVLSHESAALLHGAWLRRHELDVHLLYSFAPSSTSSPLPPVVYGGPLAWGRSSGLPPDAVEGTLLRGRVVRLCRRRRHLEAPDLTTVLGLRTTTLARTLADCLLDLPGPEAFVVGDSLLRIGTGFDRFKPEACRDALEQLLAQTRAVLGRSSGHRGVARARRMLPLLDPAAESPGESETRYWLLTLGLPPPQSQFEVPGGASSWFLDLAWERFRIALEFDGASKYALHGDALYQEKLRQERIEELGWRILRVAWADLREPTALLGRVLAALPAGIEMRLVPRPWLT